MVKKNMDRKKKKFKEKKKFHVDWEWVGRFGIIISIAVILLSPLILTSSWIVLRAFVLFAFPLCYLFNVAIGTKIEKYYIEVEENE